MSFVLSNVFNLVLFENLQKKYVDFGFTIFGRLYVCVSVCVCVFNVNTYVYWFINYISIENNRGITYYRNVRMFRVPSTGICIRRQKAHVE